MAKTYNSHLLKPVDKNPDAVINYHTPYSAQIHYNPDGRKQRKYGPSLVGQFVVQYDVERKLDAGEFIIRQGYFVHIISPNGLSPIPKDILFILDVSGSMQGRKIKQLQV